MSSKKQLIAGKFLELVRSQPGILQNQIWRKLRISNRLCSKIAIELESRGLISREPVLIKGAKTFKIKYLGIIRPSPKPKLDYLVLYSGLKLAPCIGCSKPCEQPELCSELDSWLHSLIQ